VVGYSAFALNDIKNAVSALKKAWTA